MLYEELTGKILEVCFEISRELGSGFLESVYQNALILALKQKGLNVQAQAPLSVYFRDELIGQFFADILVDDKVIIELKAVTTLSGEHQAQVINYLKGTGKEVGLLINFGRPRIEYKRLQFPLTSHIKNPENPEKHPVNPVKQI